MLRPQGLLRDRQGSLVERLGLGAERIAIIAYPSSNSLQIVVGAEEWAKKLGLEVVLRER